MPPLIIGCIIGCCTGCGTGCDIGCGIPGLGPTPLLGQAQ